MTSAARARLGRHSGEGRGHTRVDGNGRVMAREHQHEVTQQYASMRAPGGVQGPGKVTVHPRGSARARASEAACAGEVAHMRETAHMSKADHKFWVYLYTRVRYPQRYPVRAVVIRFFTKLQQWLQ